MQLVTHNVRLVKRKSTPDEAIPDRYLIRSIAWFDLVLFGQLEVSSSIKSEAVVLLRSCDYRGGRHMRSLISIDCPAQKWNLKAHMWYQLSPFPSSTIAMQHHPGNIHQSFATPRYSATPCYVLIQVPNVIDTISKRWRSKKAFNTSLSTSFS